MWTAIEGIRADGLDVSWDGDPVDGRSCKGAWRNRLESSSDGDGIEVAASFKDTAIVGSHRFHAIRNGDSLERWAIGESVIIDELDIAANGDWFKFRTLLECISSNSGDIIGLAVIGHGGGNGDGAAVKETTVACGHGYGTTSAVDVVVDASWLEIVGVGGECYEHACCHKCWFE